MHDSGLLASILADPDDPARCSALAGWFHDNGRDDEAAVVRVFWPVIRDSLEVGRTLESALELVRRNAARLGRRARGFEEQSVTGLKGRL